MRPSISLCMIVRNEEGNLPECLAGMKGLVDEIVVVDTGSTDRTREVAAGLGAKVYDFPWVDDFAAARNESRRHATGQWIFWLDADDRIDDVNRRQLVSLFEQLSEQDLARDVAYLMWCRWASADGEAAGMSHARLFPNASALAWKGRIHESLVAPDDACTIAGRPTEVVIRHVGYEDEALVFRKQQRDLRLLQIEYATNPNDPTTLFYLARVHLGLGRATEALRLLRKSIRLAAQRQYTWTRKAHVLAATCLLDLKRPVEALAACEAGLAQYPRRS